MTEQFKWVDYYEEFTSKLLEYRNNRKELIDKLVKVFDSIEMKLENAILALASLYIIEIYLMKELFGNMSIVYTYPTVYFKCKYLPHPVSSGEGLLPDEGGLSPTERYMKDYSDMFKKLDGENK